MQKRFAIFLNGPTLSGKSTIGAMLAAQLKGTTFIEGDTLVGRTGRSANEWTDDSLQEAARRLVTEAKEGRLGVLAFPLRNRDWERLARACQAEGVTPICITLAPPLAVALSGRGSKRLGAEEEQRVRRMYEEGYARREFSALTLDNGAESPGATTAKVTGFLASLTGVQVW